VSTALYHRLFSRSPLPVILQAEAAECALACLAMVAAFYGHKESLAELRRRYSVSLKGTTLKSLIAGADGQPGIVSLRANSARTMKRARIRVESTNTVVIMPNRTGWAIITAP